MGTNPPENHEATQKEKPQYVTTAYLTRMYGVTPQTVNQWARDGRITPAATYITGRDNQVRNLYTKPEQMCTQWWRDDDGNLCFCCLVRGHSTECADVDGRHFSKTVEMI
jgi:hypothetical protein